MKKLIFTLVLVFVSVATFANSNNPTNPKKEKKANKKATTEALANKASVFNGINTEFDYQLTTGKGQLIVGVQKATKGDFDLSVVSSTGKKIFTESVSNSDGMIFKIDMKDIESGEFFLSITTDQNVVYKPFKI